MAKEILKPAQLKRHSHFALGCAGFFILILTVLVLNGCKRDRLSNDTYEFYINPPATTVVVGGTQTFAVQGSALTETIAGSVTWSISPVDDAVFTGSQLGGITSIQFDAAGNYTLTAETNSRSALSYIAVEPEGVIHIYSDRGLMWGISLSTVNGGDFPIETTVDGAGEGNRYFRVTGMTHLEGWGMYFGSIPEGTGYSNGKIKFKVRKSRALNTGLSEYLKLTIDPDGEGGLPASDVYSHNFSFSGSYGPSDSPPGYTNAGANIWQQVEIDLQNFSGVDGLALVPFQISVGLWHSNDPLTLDIDDIRWEK